MHEHDQNADVGFGLTPEARARRTAYGVERCVVVQLAPDAGCDEATLRRVWHTLPARHALLTMATGEVAGFRGERLLPAAPPRPLPWLRVDVAGGELALDSTVASLRAAGLPTQAAQDGAHVAALWLTASEVPATRLLIIARAWLFDEASVLQLATELVGQAGTFRGVAASDGAPLPDDDMPLAYEDFAAWRDSLVAEDAAGAGAAYWHARLAAAGDEAVRLPLRMAGPRADVARAAAGAAAQSQASQATDATQATEATEATVARATPAEQAYALATLAREQGLPLATLLQTLWWLLLARLGGVAVLSGVEHHDCRDDYPPLAATLGVFERVLPVRFEVDATQSALAMARRLESQLATDREWQEAVPATPAAFHAAAFRVVRWRNPSGAVRLIDIDQPLGDTELRLEPIVDGEDGLRGLVLRYDPRRYDADAMRTLLDQYLTVLAAVVDVPTRAWQDVSPEPVQIVTRRLAWQGPARVASDATVVAALLRHARTQPDAPALADGRGVLSYAQLATRVTSGAAQLHARGVVAGDRVALRSPRSVEAVVAMLAILHAGAAYVPVDPAWPGPRTEALLRQVAPRLALGDEPVTASAAALRSPSDAAAPVDAALRWCDLDALAAAPLPAAGVSVQATPDANPDSIAYVIFTSGSTGQPKGVPIGHRQLLNYAAGVADELGLAPSERVALTSSLAADLGNTALFGAFVAGSCLVVADDSDMADAHSFARFLERERIDAVKLTPSHLDALLPESGGVLPGRVVLGGEAALPALLRRLRRTRADVQVFNHYGPTETTVGVLMHRCGGTDDAAGIGSGLPLTRLLPNCRAYVCQTGHDGALSLAPTGAVGILYLGGAQLMDGYLGRDPDEGFVADPWQVGERLYRTGDLACYLPGDGVSWLGRADRQVKIRGYRIEPAEVEAAGRDVPGVAQFVVRAWQGGGQTRLAGYVVAAAPTTAPTTATAPVSDASAQSAAGDDLLARVHAALTRALPPAWVPDTLQALTHLPRLGNGKIDRNALPEPAQSEAGGRPAHGPLEQWLARTLATLLSRSDVDVERGLFELGGDSLTVIRYVARITEGLRVEILPGLVFANPSVAALARAIDAQDGSGAAARRAQARLAFDAMSPEQQAAWRDRARQAASSASGSALANADATQPS
ncbi:amino acid adenylation domain-containing protein [Chitinasiproducens palmae]|uniref:Amino acid adenylation domain-containing protein n=1 Tax=Chitinasiproducens palmae TaxID=1770053 RepID=A0A1H2PIP1_9BURK|nr:amino acid adenylation domain-containing protein [Chitinasiproducens palmae]SDV46052.1 amino acid adenylation domain-containing protein [Chitinasiproducens palmae]